MRRALAFLRRAPRLSFSPFTGRRCHEVTDKGQNPRRLGLRRPSSGCPHLLPVNGEKHAGIGHRFLPALTLVFCLATAPALAGDLANLPTTRTDLTPKDLARVVAITKPTKDFSKPEQFELMQGGA